MEKEEEKWREINRVGKDNVDYYALAFNHKSPVCSSSGNWERKAQDEGDSGCLSCCDSQQMFAQMFVCFHAVFPYEESSHAAHPGH